VVLIKSLKLKLLIVSGVILFMTYSEYLSIKYNLCSLVNLMVMVLLYFLIIVLLPSYCLYRLTDRVLIKSVLQREIYYSSYYIVLKSVEKKFRTLFTIHSSRSHRLTARRHPIEPADTLARLPGPVQTHSATV
jgi:hypothetical protein